MKKKIALMLSLLMLLCTACGMGENVPFAQSTPPEELPTVTVGTLQQYAFTCGGMTGINVGDAYYEYIRMGDADQSEARMVKTDYATLQQTCVCTKEGCAHADENCNAFIKDWARINMMVIGNQIIQSYMGYTSDPEWEKTLEENYQNGKVSQKDYETRKNEHKSNSNSYVDVMNLDGSERRRVVEFPANLQPELTSGYTDGAALYVRCHDSEAENSSVMYRSLMRIDLASGELQTMAMQNGERVETVIDNKFIVSHLECEEDLKQLEQSGNWEAYDAARKNGKMQYDAVDFATQKRETLYTSQRFDDMYFNMPIFMDGKQYGVYADVNQETSTGKRSDLRCVDFTAGTNTVLVENLPSGGAYSHCTSYAAAAMPQGMEGKQDYIRLSYVLESGLDTVEYIYCISKNQLTKITQRCQLFDGMATPSAIAQTTDGRWLIGIGSMQNQNNSRFVYGLISPEDFMEGKENYQKIEMFSPI